ncbi:MAG: hypothetical protein V3S55_08400 [Nitrospiraceae bacterium]
MTDSLEDTALLALEAELTTFRNEIDAGLHPEEGGDVPDPAIKHLDEIERKIAATPASTFVGIAIKLRIGVDNLDPLDPGETRTTDELNLESALADLERLAGRAI